MKLKTFLKSEHVVSDEVKFTNGILKCSIAVNDENRGEEEIGYDPSQKARVEAALSHAHGPTTFQLDSIGQDVAEVLKMADAHFQSEVPLKDKYSDLLWSTHKKGGMEWEGQKSILVGRCDAEVVSIACLDLRLITSDQASKPKFVSIGVGPFFVPPDLRGRAHSIELSIAVSHLATVLQQAQYLLLPKFGCMGVSVYPDYPSEFETDLVHPFVEQIFDKVVVMQEIG